MVGMVLAQGLRMRCEGPSEKSIASGTRVFQRKPFKDLELLCLQQPRRFDPVLTSLYPSKIIISSKFKVVRPQFFSAQMTFQTWLKEVRTVWTQGLSMVRS